MRTLVATAALAALAVAPALAVVVLAPPRPKPVCWFRVEEPDWPRPPGIILELGREIIAPPASPGDNRRPLTPERRLDGWTIYQHPRAVR